MAGTNAAASQTALLLTLQIWESLINDKYMKEACHYNAPPCPTCKSPRDCNNYFCLQCKAGGLCPAVFRGDHEHRHHPWLQVRHYTRQYSVLSTDLAHFISKEGLKHIHTNKLNGEHRHCNLRSKRVAQASSSSSSTRARARAAGEKSCQGCTASIRGAKNSKETFLVCSLQCLVKVARERSELKMLEMKDGAMGPMNPPLFFTEKLMKRPRMLETPTNTPIDEAPPSPQVTGDSSMHEAHEVSAEKPVVEAPPLPQATGDSPMLEAHAVAAEKPVVEAPPLPQATDNYPMLGNPAEASSGEALQFPPATVEENPAAPAEPPKLETFALPPDFQGLDFSLEWVEMWIEPSLVL